jgi:hypothetical protein
MPFISLFFIVSQCARTLSGVLNFLIRVATLILLFYEVIYWNFNIALLDTWEGIYDSLFHLIFRTYSFELFIEIETILLLFIIYYPPNVYKNHWDLGCKKIYSFFLTNYIIVLLGSLLILLFTNIFFLHISFVYLATSFSSIFYNDYLLCLVPIKIYDNLFFDKARIFFF